MFYKMRTLLLTGFVGFFSVPLTSLAATSDFGIGTQNPGLGGNTADFATVIARFISMILSFVGALAVLIIVIAGVMYMISGGDENRIETAKKWLLYGIIGLVVVLLAWVIVNTIVTAGCINLLGIPVLC